MPALAKPRIDPALVRPLSLALTGLAAAAAAPFAVAGTAGVALSVVVAGLACLSAALALDRPRRVLTEELARRLGEFNVRLAATRIKVEAIETHLAALPMSEAEAAPARATLAELTAEVGLLGGLLRDAMTALSEHDEKLAALDRQARMSGDEKVQATVEGLVADAQQRLKAAAAPAPAQPAPAPPVPPPERAGTTPPAVPAPKLEAPRSEMPRPEVPRPADEAAIRAALGGNGLDVHLQPIVALPQRRTIGYELLARLTLAGGEVLAAASFMPVAERAGQSGLVDAQVLTRALALAGHLNARADRKAPDAFLALNLSEATWADARQLGSILRILETYKAQAGRLVLEVPQRVFRGLDPVRLGLLSGFAKLGARLALDGVRDLRFDPVGLAERGIRFVKAPCWLLSDLLEQPRGGDIDPSDFATLLRRSGIEMIAERAEDDRAIADAIEMDIRFAQGHAISPPRAIRADVFASPPAAAPAEKQPDDAPLTPPPAANPEAAQPERLPFRAVLRRA